LVGVPGLFYDYILAENGLFVRAQSPLLEATLNITPAEVRGLLPLEEKVRLPKGRIPRSIYDLALSVVSADRYHEHYLAVTWEDGYQLRVPWQSGSSSGVQYEVLPNTVLDIHSHGDMRAFFSATDDKDEQGLCLYMVVGRFNTLFPEVELRVGVYGYFAPVWAKEVFE